MDIIAHTHIAVVNERGQRQQTSKAKKCLQNVLVKTVFPLSFEENIVNYKVLHINRSCKKCKNKEMKTAFSIKKLQGTKKI